MAPGAVAHAELDAEVDAKPTKSTANATEIRLNVAENQRRMQR